MTNYRIVLSLVGKDVSVAPASMSFANIRIRRPGDILELGRRRGQPADDTTVWIDAHDGVSFDEFVSAIDKVDWVWSSDWDEALTSFCIYEAGAQLELAPTRESLSILARRQLSLLVSG